MRLSVFLLGFFHVAGQRFNVEKDRFDVVVTWTSRSSQLSVLKDNYVVFTLRSLVKYGMMTWIRKIFVIYDDYFDAPPPWFVEGPVLKVVPWSSVFHGQGVDYSLASFARMSDLSEFFMLIPQHTFLCQLVAIRTLFNEEGRLLVRDCAKGARLFARRASFCPFIIKKSILSDVQGTFSSFDDALMAKHLETGVGAFAPTAQYCTSFCASSSLLVNFTDLESSNVWISLV